MLFFRLAKTFLPAPAAILAVTFDMWALKLNAAKVHRATIQADNFPFFRVFFCNFFQI
jgi:hypothetical protein